MVKIGHSKDKGLVCDDVLERFGRYFKEDCDYAKDLNGGIRRNFSNLGNIFSPNPLNTNPTSFSLPFPHIIHYIYPYSPSYNLHILLPLFPGLDLILV